MALENVLPAGADTLLVISGLGGFQYQARNINQTLSIIKDASQLERTINGKLIDLSNPIFRKYSTKITCTDVDAPPLDNLFPGMEVTFYCACSLAYQIGNPGSPNRPVVSGSDYTQGHYAFYRPVLDCRIVNVSEDFKEWRSEVSWEIEAEEI